MADHLQNAGHALFVFNRSREKAEYLVENGAHWASSSAEVAGQSEIVVMIVGLPKNVGGLSWREGGFAAQDLLAPGRA